MEEFGEDAIDDSVAAALADCDGDGIENLIEYATGSDPTDAASILLPCIGAGPAVIYTARTNDTLLHCTLQETPQLTPAQWMDITTPVFQETSNDEYCLFSTQLSNTTRFYRLIITRSTD